MIEGASSDADFSNAHLIGADLSRADFEGADLSGADPSGADFEGADFCRTRMPDGSENNSDCY